MGQTGKKYLAVMMVFVFIGSSVVSAVVQAKENLPEKLEKSIMDAEGEQANGESEKGNLWETVNMKKEKTVTEDTPYIEDTSCMTEEMIDHTINEEQKVCISLLVQCEQKLENNYNCDNLLDFGKLKVLEYTNADRAETAFQYLKEQESQGIIDSVEINQPVETATVEEQWENIETKKPMNKMEEEKSTEKMLVEAATEMQVNSRDILVAVIDTGYDKAKGCMERIKDSQFNCSNMGNVDDITDHMGHGTQMASIILANTSEAVKVMPIKALNDQGTGDLLSIYQAISYAVEQKADIINLSVEGYQILSSPLLVETLGNALTQGILVITSAGNQAADISQMLQNKLGNTLVISAVNENLQKSSYSNYGEGIDFAAYGTVNAYGLNLQLQEASGTSVAAAIVSAVAAECMVMDNSADYQKILHILEKGAYISEHMEEMKQNYGKGILAKSTIQGLYETQICEQAEIFQCDYKHISDEKLNKVIQSTTEVNLRLFLKQLSRQDLSELLLRDTDLNKTAQRVILDENYNVLENQSFLYYKYLLEDNFTTQSVTTFGCTTGYFYAKYNQDGQESDTTKITVQVTNVRPNVVFTNVPVYTLTSSNKDVFYIADEQTETKPDNNGNYYVLYTMLCRDKVPAHYTATSWVDDHVQTDNSDVVGLERVTTGHQESSYTCEFLLNVDTNGTGLTWWGPQQANGIDTEHKYERFARHTTITVEFSSWKEKLYIDPNGGSYSYTKDGENVTKDEKFLLATKQCKKTSSIGVPKRTGYVFKGWDTSHENGGSGTYDKTTKKYTFCGKKKNAASTLKALWATPTPKPTKTPTPKPTNTSTPKPTHTATPKPTNTSTPKPTSTPTAKPTNIPLPIVTKIPTSDPTNIPTSKPTNTPTPKLTNTPMPTPFEFAVTYHRNEPTELTKKAIHQGQPVVYGEDSVGNLLPVGEEAEAEFAGWCLGLGQWTDKGEDSCLQGVYWLQEDGNFSIERTDIGEGGKISTDTYKGEVLEDKADLKKLHPYMNKIKQYAENNASMECLKNLVLVGKWTVSIEFDAMEGTNPKELSEKLKVPADEAFVLPKEIPVLQGCSFAGWYESQQQKIYQKGSDILGFGKNKKLQALYQYTIQYQRADGSLINNEYGQGEFAKPYGVDIVLDDVNYPIDGNTKGHHYSKNSQWQVIEADSGIYCFAKSWHYPGKNYQDMYIQGERALINRSVILRALEETNTYVIHYHENAEKASTKKFLHWNSQQEKQEIEYGEEVSLKSMESSALPGYEFRGWNTKEDGSGVSFGSGEHINVTKLLEETGTEPQRQESIIPLYAQWIPKTYVLTFCENTPTANNNTHEATAKAQLQGTSKVEYVWDSYISRQGIEDIGLPNAVLTGWHPRFSDSLWYTESKYDKPGQAFKDGARLGYELLGMPGDKNIYAQWEANTYHIAYYGYGKEEGGRGKIEGEMNLQTMVYDMPSSLFPNTFQKQDENFCYHDDEKLKENIYSIKYNSNAETDYQYYYLGWSRIPVPQMKVEDTNTWISGAEAEQKKIWNFTTKNKDTVSLYACWDGIPNITTFSSEVHFDRYEGAKLTAKDMKALVKAYDIEQGESLPIRISNISYYDEGTLLDSVDNPENSYLLDTTLPKKLQREGGFKTYQITYETVDEWGVSPYHENNAGKKVSYMGKIYYNQVPELVSYDGSPKLPERFFYQEDIRKLSAEELENKLLLAIQGIDREDMEFQKDRDNYLYQGRFREEPELQVTGVEKLLQKLAVWSETVEEEKEVEISLQYMISYEDIFGKLAKIESAFHVIDGKQAVWQEQQKGKAQIRFISKEYMETIDSDSKWFKEEEYRNLLESLLQEEIQQEEVYELENGKFLNAT